MHQKDQKLKLDEGHFPNCPSDPSRGLFLCYDYGVIERDLMTKVLEFADSSAVAKISIDNINNEIGVAFTSKPDNFYIFECGDVSKFETKVAEVIGAKESLGKFIASSRKDGTLVAV